MSRSRASRRVSAKICGITTLRDAQLATAVGADAIGFIFAAGDRRKSLWDSPRRVTPATAARIIRQLPKTIIPVGVFVNAAPARVAAIAKQCRLGRVQLHGDESPADCRVIRRRTKLPVVKAIRVAEVVDLDVIPAYRGAVDAILLDTKQAGSRALARGGTGKTFNWALAVHAKRAGLPIILAGGLRPATVARAIRRVRPSEVDVSSGVEASPGRKDPARVRAFLLAVRRVVQ